MLFRKCRRNYVEKDLAYQQLRWTKIFAYADDVVISTFGPQASWIVEKFMELAQKFNFKVNITNSNFVSNLKNAEQKYDLKGITKTKCFKYLGVLISARGSIESHRQLIKKRIQFLCNQLVSLNKFLPIRNMTQLWNSFIKPHFDYIVPLMGYFSLNHVTKWKQLYRQSIKKTLQLPQYLPNEELDKIWKQFRFKPSTLLEPTLQQANRFQEELKRTQQPIAKLKLLINANEYWQQWRDLRFDQGHINNEFQKKDEKQKLITSNLKIKYIPNQGYLERFKHSWKQCKCGERWTFKHLELHDIALKNEYEALENEINSYLLSGSQIYQLQFFYQDYICEKIQAFNVRLFKLVDSNTIAPQSLHSRL